MRQSGRQGDEGGERHAQQQARVLLEAEAQVLVDAEIQLHLSRFGRVLEGDLEGIRHRPAPARGRAPVFQGEIVALWVREAADVAHHAQHPVAQRGRLLLFPEEPAVLRRQLHLVVHEGRVLVVGRQKHLEGENRPVIRRLGHGKRHALGGLPLHPARGQIRHALRQRGRGRRRRRAKEQQRRHKRAGPSFHLSNASFVFPVLRKTVIHTTNGRA